MTSIFCLDELMANETRWRDFKTICEREYAIENCLFLEHVQFFRDNYETNTWSWRLCFEAALTIQKRYMDMESDLCLNISGITSDEIDKTLQNCKLNKSLVPKTIFDSAHHEVRNNLLDKYLRYREFELTSEPQNTPTHRSQSSKFKSSISGKFSALRRNRLSQDRFFSRSRRSSNSSDSSSGSVGDFGTLDILEPSGAILSLEIDEDELKTDFPAPKSCPILRPTTTSNNRRSRRFRRSHSVKRRRSLSRHFFNKDGHKRNSPRATPPQSSKSGRLSLRKRRSSSRRRSLTTPRHRKNFAVLVEVSG